MYLSVRMLESQTPSPEIKKELRKRFNRLDPHMSVDDPFLHEELLKRFRSYLLSILFFEYPQNILGFKSSTHVRYPS
ncbi:hypothetical protein LEP1GSC056_4129 [Leptospira borgpetersenii str. Brem 328]|uniref:Uncharacterized protein n=1 Tax=Leptospira borgpetersenii str. Brem 328 TaxID=1049780 RepID=A0ABC9SD63_LEPBO|nr:hypothetical protein LEP1GSC056_4129 [Leptospira borgpetersenii str. Brem 328]